MNEKELNEIIKQHPDVIGLRKTSVGMSAIWLVASIIFLFINPLIGIIGLCLFPILLLCYWIAYKGKMKYIRSQIDKTGIYWLESPNEAPIHKKKVNKSNAVVNTAASYALGKAVTDGVKKSTVIENPYKDKQASASSRMVSSKYVSKMGKSQKCCGTCQYWTGSRDLDAINHGRIANIISKESLLKIKGDVHEHAKIGLLCRNRCIFQATKKEGFLPSF